MYYYVYIATNLTNSVLYTGFTSDLPGRIHAHRNKLVDGFTKRYNIWKLVYYEAGDDRTGVLEREKQIKSWPRARKISLVESMNPGWRDLYWDFVDQ
jgi:putative endonuclease